MVYYNKNHCGYIVKISNLRNHSNADRLQIATIFLNDVIVDKSVQIGDMGVYFPIDLQLSKEFCEANDLVRRKDENGNQCGGYLDPNKRNIKALKLRGEKSEGLFLPLISLANFCAISDLKEGDQITILNGVEICKKYIPAVNNNWYVKGNHPAKARANFAPTFFEHIDTLQLAFNLNEFKAGQVIELTLKMHGTSGRTGYLPLLHTKRTWFDKLLNRHGKDYTEYGYVNGTRRVAFNEDYEDDFCEDISFRKEMGKKFEGKLYKGETVYYEIVGFQGTNGAPIMPSVKNSKISDKEFAKKYGDETVFSYGCDKAGGYSEGFILNEWYDTEAATLDVIKPCCELYVYRMTMVNEDGDVVEYSPDQMRARCEQIGVKYVPVFERFIIPDDVNAGEYVVRKVEQYFDGADPIGKTHVREGVVVRIVSSPKIAVYKHKNFNFRVLSGIAADSLTDEQISQMEPDLLAEV